MRLFGPSDVISIVHNGHQHGPKRGIDRVKATQEFGAEGRTLPVIDCPQCEDFLRREGWTPTPDKAPLTTDERDYVERAKEDGDVATRELLRTLSQVVGDSVAGRTAH